MLFTPTLQDKGMRLDKYLASQEVLQAKDYSRSRIVALIEEGNVQMDNNIIYNISAKIIPDAVIKLTFPAPVSAVPEAQNIPLDILYEDDDVIVINKPAGLTVHPAAGNHDKTLVNALLYHCKDSLSGIGGVLRPGIVHRIDKDTSGVMVVAKNDHAHHHLSEQFANHSMTRIYHAIVHLGTQNPTGTIAGNIGRSPHNRQKMALLQTGGKHAVTHYRTLKRFIYNKRLIASLMEYRLETGRTHQIRVHSASAGFPLVGDPLYGTSSLSSYKTLPEEIKTAFVMYPYQALHAKVLGFVHPKTEEYLEFSTDYPSVFQNLYNFIF